MGINQSKEGKALRSELNEIKKLLKDLNGR